MILFLLGVLYGDDDTKFYNIFSRYKAQMYNDAVSVLKNKKDAEDAVQNACILLLPHLNDKVFDDIESEGAFKYIRETVKNAALSILGKRTGSEQYSESEAYGDFEDSIVDNMTVKELYAAVIKTINAMDEIYRDALFRHYVLGQTVKEIARITHTKPDTVEKRIYRGKKIILEKVNPKDYGYE